MASADVQIDSSGTFRPERSEPGGQVARREDRVVRQDQERPLLLDQPLQEFGGAGQCVFFADEHAVHVGEPALRR